MRKRWEEIVQEYERTWNIRRGWVGELEDQEESQTTRKSNWSTRGETRNGEGAAGRPRRRSDRYAATKGWEEGPIGTTRRCRNG